ncbi:MAG: hypothetical protein WBF77_08480 [Sulfurimonadaceae bacterium]
MSMPMMADEEMAHKKLPLSESLPLLKTIESSALRMGNGPDKVHVFVDPMCPHSRNFVEMISESEKMRSRYSYYFYLYTLPRLHSETVVAAIYNAKDPTESLLDVMVKHKKVTSTEVKNNTVTTKVNAIADVAKQIDVYKRPYIIMVKKPKKKREK